MAVRIITGLIMATAAVLLTALGPAWGTYLLFQLAAFVAADEFYRIVYKGGATRERWVGMLYVASATATSWWLPDYTVHSLALGIPILLSTVLFSDLTVEEMGPRSAFLVAGAYYLALPLMCLMGITALPSGPHYVLALFSAIFAGDTGAFFAGKFLGKRKLYEKISPKKTWAGAFGGAAASVFGFCLVVVLADLPIALPVAAAVGLSCGIAGAIGDLAESMFKRSFGVKDSGSKLPGHGGLLDRVDGLLFGAPIMWIFLSLAGIA